MLHFLLIMCYNAGDGFPEPFSPHCFTSGNDRPCSRTGGLFFSPRHPCGKIMLISIDDFLPKPFVLGGNFFCPDLGQSIPHVRFKEIQHPEFLLAPFVPAVNFFHAVKAFSDLCHVCLLNHHRIFRRSPGAIRNNGVFPCKISLHGDHGTHANQISGGSQYHP